MVLAIIVAVATPVTPQLNTATKSRFIPAFIMPEIKRHIRGLMVSPLLLSIAAQKLYRAISGIPAKYSRRYFTAMYMTSGGESMAFRMGHALIIPTSPKNMPPVRAMSTVV